MKLIIIVILFFFIIIVSAESCHNFDNNYYCINDQQYSFPDDWDERCFQTPPRNDIYGKYNPNYQDMHYLVGYAQLKYSQDKKSCTITFITKVNPILEKEKENYTIIYKFGDIYQINTNNITITSDQSFPDGMEISVEIIDNNNNHLVGLVLEKEYFIWDHPQINLPDNYENGQKGVIVELFGWPYDDIAEECEFLGHAGYMGVKILPPNESLLTYRKTTNGELNPMNYIFESVSYKLESRMGNKTQLNNMINKCRQNGVRIYAEIVINHMCSNGNDLYDKHINDDCSTWGPIEGSAGSPFWTMKGLDKNNPYTNLPPVIEFPSVPYFASDFHCKGKNHLNYGWLSDLVDLNSEKEYVQQRIADFFTELISIGFSGFEFDSGISLFPKNYATIFKKFKENLGGGDLPNDFMTYIQVDMWEGWHKTVYICESNNEYNFAENFVNLMVGEGLSENDIKKIKIWNAGYFEEKFPICDGNWKISEERFVVGWVNNYVQYPYASDIYMRDKNLLEHKRKYVQLLKDNSKNWKIKLVYSAYSIMNNEAVGFPDGKSDCNKCINEECKKSCTKSVPYKKAYRPLSTGYDSGDATNWKEGTYTRVHRNFEIVNAMREWMGLNLFPNENELYKYEILKGNCPKGCLICNEESSNLDLCILCNKEEEYYPINYDNINEKYYQCLHISSKIPKLFFDKENECFKPCYDSCKTCEKKGNEANHNCLSCEAIFTFRENEEKIPKNNCVLNCSYPYYFTKDGQYKCSKNPTCITDANLLIKEKNKCIDDCKKDDTYKYQYNGNCIKSCPDNTKNDSFICIEINKDECKLKEAEVILDNSFINESIFSLVKAYSKEFYYTDNQITKYSNKEYDIIFYKNINCIKELSLDIPITDFGECYQKVQNNYSINDSLIIVTLNEYIGKGDSYVTTHSFYNPMTSEKLDVEKICKNSSILVENNIYSILKDKNINYDMLTYFIKQNIDIFDTSNPFYTDICYDYESPVNKDITLKDRLLAIFPNVSLCENGCQSKTVNLTEMKAICDCKFHDILNNDIFKENVLINSATDEIIHLITNNNLEVLKCYKYIFKYFKKSFGGFISLFFIICQIILTIIFYLSDKGKIKQYIFDLIDKYLEYLLSKANNTTENKDKENPPKKDPNKRKTTVNGNNYNFTRNIILNFNINKKHKTKIRKKSSNKSVIPDPNNNKSKSKSFHNSSKGNSPLLKISSSNKISSKYRKTSKLYTKNFSKFKLNTEKNKHKNKKNSIFVDISEYLEPSLDDMDFDEVLKKDKRKFCVYISDSIKENLLIVNAFFIKDQLNPKSIKIMLFNLNFIFYFIINGLFYNEDYISTVYHIKKKETFFSFFPRSLQRLLYTSIVSLVIKIIIECFLIEENKLKRIFIREKNNEFSLKYEVTLLFKNMNKRFLSFIIVCFCLHLFFFYYLLCFNYVYKHTQIEWIKSSVTIVILMQLLNILSITFEAILRYMSFYFKSDKMFKISKYFS